MKVKREWALLARYVYTHEEFVIVTEVPQSNRSQMIKNNIQIDNVQKYNIEYRQLYMYRYDMCKFEM